MRGVDLNLPKLPHGALVGGDFVQWEVLYDDGTTYREDLGGVYAEIERGRLRSFRLVKAGEILVEGFPPAGATGHNLCYRRRTDTTAGGERRVFQLVGWVPMGPVIALYEQGGIYWTAENFHQLCPRCGGEHPAGLFAPPIPLPDEGERFSFPKDDPLSGG